MPEHILDKIFNYLDFHEKITFSEVCETFNGIFGWRKNLKKVSFNMKKANKNSEIMRPYVNIGINDSNYENMVSHLLYPGMSCRLG